MSDPLARRMDDGPLFARAKPQADCPVKPQRVAPRPMAATSLAANEHVDRGADYLLILRWLNARRVDGGTHGEWCEAFDRESSTSGRFTELAAAELIAGLPGETRRVNGRRAAQVYRLSDSGLAALRSGEDAILSAVRAIRPRKSA